MASKKPERSPDYRGNLCRLLEHHLEVRGWKPATLAKQSGQSKATISRMLSYARDPNYRPTLAAVQAVALALRLTLVEGQELFYAAFPEFSIWEEALAKGYDLGKTDDMLDDNGLPTLTKKE